MWPYWPLLQLVRMQRDGLFARCRLFVVGLDPVVPMLAGGAIFAADLLTRDLGVAYFALFGSAGGEVLDERIGEGGAGVAVEDVGFKLLAGLERKRDIAAIVECLFKRLAKRVVAGELRNPAFKISWCSVPGATSRASTCSRVYFEHFGAHALVSSRFHARAQRSAPAEPRREAWARREA